MAKLRDGTIQQWSADFIDALQESQIDKGPLGPIVAEPPTPWPLRSVNSGVQYH